MQETVTFPTVGSPHHRFTFSQAFYTEYSQRCSPVSTPFVSAPSSPGRHGHGDLYFSAPTSPHWAHASEFMASEDTVRGYPSAIPFCREDKPWTLRRSSECKSKGNGNGNGNGKDEAGSFVMNSDFEFSARFAELDDPSMSPTPMSSANELFCNGQIKPLKLPPRLEQQPCFANHIIINEHALTAQTRAFEFNNRGPTMVVGSNSSLSAPQSPRFSSTLGCITGDSSACAISELNRGRSAACSNSLSAPQSPCSPLSRVKKALCGVSSRVEKAFDPSLGMAIEGSREPKEDSRGQKEGSKSSMASITHSIQATGHRRTRSFSPLRIFHREERPSSKSLEQEEGVLWRDSSVNDKKKEESSSAQKSFKKWTLKDLLHRKNGGESRSSSSRASSRRSSPSMDSTSPREKQSARSTTGRSSSESSHTSFSSDPIIKDSIAIGGCRTMTHMGDNIIDDNNANTVSGKGIIPLGDIINNNRSSSSSNNNNDDGKAKTLGQRGNKAVSPHEKAVSPHELHYMMHKAQSEELRKKTFLPYRKGLLSCLGFTSRSYRTVSTISKTLQSVSG